MYSRCCSKRDKLWKTAKAFNKHEKSCEATVRHVLPGGAYKAQQTIFDLREHERIHIQEDSKYFPYHTTFDFECYFKKEDQHQRKPVNLHGKSNISC